MDLIFALTYHWLQRRVTQFGVTVAERLTEQVTALCVVLVTIWVLVQGYRLVTGASREPAMVLVSHMIKVSLIVFAARTVAVSGTELFTFLNTTVPQEISYVVSGNDASDMVDKIDQNLLKVSAGTSVIDMVQVPAGDIALARQKNRATWMATIGIAAPAISAGCLLLLYQIAMAILLGMAPFFILCLVFDRTKDLFRRWLMYWLSTLFSMAMLSVVVTWVLTLTLNIAEATWVTDTLAAMTGQNAQGFNTIALQQGGIGLLMTVLIISTPPMAAALFQGALGTFIPFAAFGAGALSRRRAHANNAPARLAVHASPPDRGDSHGTPPLRHLPGTSTSQPDAIKRHSTPEPSHPTGVPIVSDEAMARAAYGDPRYWTAQVGPPAPGTGTTAALPVTPPAETPPEGQPATTQPQPEQTVAPPVLTADNVSVNYAAGVDRSSISDSAELVLREICARANISAVTLSSAARTADSQANAMYENAEARGLDSQRRLYGRDGNAVLDQYQQGRAQGLDAASIKENMSRVIMEHPDSFHHVSRAPNLSVFDVSPSSIGSEQARRRLAIEAQADARVVRFFQPPNDPGFHFEIQDP